MHPRRSIVAAILMLLAAGAGTGAAARDASGAWAGSETLGAAGPWPRPQVLAAIEPAAGRASNGGPDLRPPAPARPVVAAPTGQRLGAFASVAISAGRLPAAAKWRNATATDFTALFTDRCAESGLPACDTRLARTLRATGRAAGEQAAPVAIATVNAAVNRALRYSPDRVVWGRGDYWATPAETARKGAGDCEDFAIAKYWLLRSLGFGTEQLQLVVLEDTRKGVYHAVLAVHLEGTRYILDNLSDRVATDAAFPGYMPIMSFVGERSFIHGFEARRTETAGARDLGAVLPGEGV